MALGQSTTRAHERATSNAFLLLLITVHWGMLDCTKASSLRYFSVWDLETANPEIDDVKSFANFVFTTSDMMQIQKFSAAGIGPNLLSVFPTFFARSSSGLTLRQDYAAAWETLLTSTVKPGLANGTLLGVFFGDELVWNCLSYSNLTTAVDLVRSDLPRGSAILYQNEAFPTFTGTFQNGSTGYGLCQDPQGRYHNVSYPAVPAGLDWISIDYYPDEGTIHGARDIYNELIYPKMADHHRALYIPPAYGASSYLNTTDNVTEAARLCCNQVTRDGPNPQCNGNCSKAMIDWAVDAYNWAREDPRIIGLNPWHWDTLSPGPEFEPGLGRMPAVKAIFKKIGGEIVSGRLGDVTVD